MERSNGGWMGEFLRHFHVVSKRVKLRSSQKKRGGVAVKYRRRKEFVRKYLSWSDFDTIHNNLLCINFLKSFW